MSSQMQNLTAHSHRMDPELLFKRRSATMDYIIQLLQRKNYPNSEVLQRIPEIARRLEERIFRDSLLQGEDYINMSSTMIEQRLQAITKILSNNQQSHYISQQSAVTTMMPTPGLANYGSKVGSNVSLDNNILLPNGSTSINQVGSLNQSPVLNGYQQMSGNAVLSSGGMMRQPSQMIPTPGFNNQQSMPVSSEASIGIGFSSMDTSIISQQQTKQYSGNQSAHMLNNLANMRSNMQQKSSPYGFSNGVINGASAPEGYFCSVPYGVSQKINQTFATTSMPQQMLPMIGDNYAMSAPDISTSANIYGPGSAALSSANIQNSNMDTNFKVKANFAASHHAGFSSMQQSPHLRPQKFDQSQSMNFQTTNSVQEQFLQFQHQQFQQPNQQPSQLVQQPRYQLTRQPSIPSNFVGQIPSNFAGQIPPEVGIESNNESFIPQVSEQFRLSELQNQYQQNAAFSGNLHKDVLCDQDFQNSVSSQASRQILHDEHQPSISQNELSRLFCGSQTDTIPQQHWNLQSEQNPVFQENLTFGPPVQEEHFQRIMGKVEPFQPNRDSNESANISRERDYLNQKRWLLLLLHSRKCSFSKGQCKEANCVAVQQLWAHIERCESNNCSLPRCSQSKKLFNHYITCKTSDCPVCCPVREFAVSIKLRNQRASDNNLAKKENGSWKAVETASTTCLTLNETSDCQPLKRIKIEHPPTLVPKNESSSLDSVPQTNHMKPLNETGFDNYRADVFEVNVDESQMVSEQLPIIGSKLDDLPKNVPPSKMCGETSPWKDADSFVKKELHPPKMESKRDAFVPPPDPSLISKSGKPKIKGASMTELFTPEQIREHITSLRQWVGQSKAKVEKNQAMERSMSENSCQLCAVEKLAFEPPPIYCTPCGARIKRNAMYYALGPGDTRYFFCIPCYNEARGDAIEVEGSTVPKSKLDKKKNDEETEEWWVQCDKCKAWQHQICALFNGRRNEGGLAEYTCPNCYMDEIEKGERKPLPQSAVLGAKDLPRSILSDHIEQRLFRRLKLERQERARHFGKTVDEVPGAESLVVRVVSSVDKKLDVKQRFLEIFQEDNYPAEYSYKSKVVLLFQKIEGVEVCLFGMYVQEFGSECQLPNQRRVYLSYLDSVKYFRPEIRTVNGEALRTFVYHEILIGYLDYCKKRGFTSCYIWACPPLKGEDYILYCHPEIQKTPKSDKLREWYLAMLRKAAKEGIVVGLTNLFDHFFVSTGECKAKVTAARLPYFDGDYWPGAAEDMINQLRQEEDGRKQQKKGKTKMTLTKRALKAAGHSDLGCNASKDALLMQKLGETISPMKEDFIMVHLQHACSHCCVLMVSGNRWVCKQCKNFQICDKCNETEQKHDTRERHPVNSRDSHDLHPIEISDVAVDTKDKDEIVESEFFDTRQAFLTLCQGNHYQYDTLRRAKHSSMMALFHLHNPTEPAFVTTCNVCRHDVEAGQGWRCEVCPDFDVCNNCYLKDGCADHPHKLTNLPANADRDAQSKEARQNRVVQLRKMLDLLVHASQCRSPHCQYPNCRRVKGLFRHGIQCPTRASGGCYLCKRMWYLLQIHARACKESACHVPRCKDLKEHLRRLQQQSESRRRAAVMEMMRQRAAELQGTDN